MSWIFPITLILLTAVLFTVIIVKRGQPAMTGDFEKTQQKSTKKRTPIPNIFGAIFAGILTFFTFLFRNWWKIALFLAFAYIVYIVVTLTTNAVENHNNTMSAPYAPYEMTLEPGEKSPDFMLSQNGSWRVCLTPHVEILPYVTFINERRVNGERAFDGYRIENTSSGPIWFSTWQEQPPVGQVRATCN